VAAREEEDLWRGIRLPAGKVAGNKTACGEGGRDREESRGGARRRPREDAGRLLRQLLYNGVSGKTGWRM
jgi:hypothetical protein